MADLRDQASENTKQFVQNSMEMASRQTREATDRFASALGYTGEDSERLAQRSKQNMEAVTRCSTILIQAFQDASRNGFEMSGKQWKRNLDGMKKLGGAKSVQDFTAIQSEMVREGLQHMVQDSRQIAETSVRAVEEAGKTFASVAQH